MMSSPQNCNNCGQILRPGARFCPECGRSLAGPAPLDIPGSGDFSSPAGPAPTAPGYPETAQSPVSPSYMPTATWPPKAAADPVPVPTADSLSPFSSADSTGPAAPAREPGYWPASGPPGPPPGEVRAKRSRRPLLAGIIAVIVLGTGTGIALVVLPSHHRPTSNAATAGNGATARH